MQSDEKESDFLQKLDKVRDKNKLKYSHIIYMKQAEEVAVQRASQYAKRRNKCAITGIALATIPIGIYLYTIHAVKQETFLNDLFEPEKVIEKPSSETNVN